MRVHLVFCITFTGPAVRMNLVWIVESMWICIFKDNCIISCNIKLQKKFDTRRCHVTLYTRETVKVNWNVKDDAGRSCANKLDDNVTAEINLGKFSKQRKKLKELCRLSCRYFLSISHFKFKPLRLDQYYNTAWQHLLGFSTVHYALVWSVSYSLRCTVCVVRLHYKWVNSWRIQAPASFLFLLQFLAKCEGKLGTPAHAN